MLASMAEREQTRSLQAAKVQLFPQLSARRVPKICNFNSQEMQFRVTANAIPSDGSCNFSARVTAKTKKVTARAKSSLAAVFSLQVSEISTNFATKSGEARQRLSNRSKLHCVRLARALQANY